MIWCRLFHKVGKWASPKWASDGKLFQVRMCETCGKFQVRFVDGVERKATAQGAADHDAAPTARGKVQQ